MRSAIHSAAVFFSLASCLAGSDPEAWSAAPLGIRITSCAYDAHGVDVAFDTDLEPPYMIGVYRSAEVGLGRYYPVRETVTKWKNARVNCPMLDVTLFVQVMTTNAVTDRTYASVGTNGVTNVIQMTHRSLTGEEWESYRDSIRKAKAVVNDRTDATFERVREDPSMELVSDNTWIGFRESSLKDVTFSFSGRTNITEVVTNKTYCWVKMDTSYYEFENGIPATWKSPKGDWENRKSSTYTNQTCLSTFDDGRDIQDGYLYFLAKHPGYGGYWSFVSTNNANGHVSCSVMRAHDPYLRDGPCNPTKVYSLSEPVTFSASLTNADVTVGSGYRVIFFCDRNQVMVQRAYSSRTNMSDEVFIDRGFKALSTHNGYRYTADSDGRLYFQADTNNIPGIIHLEGIK